MKKPNSIPTRVPKLTTQQKLKAMTRRVSQQMLEDHEAEPTMRFSTAFIIVALLQAVAIGGIVAFNQIHKNHSAAHEARAENQPAQSETKAAGASNEAVSAAANHDPQSATAAENSSAANHQPADSAATSPLAAMPAHGASVQDSGKVYTVAKGDVPERIAKKFHVGYDDLLKLNKITDSRRLQIGQKLHIPAAHVVNE